MLLEEKLRRAAGALGLLVVALGVLVLVSWGLHRDLLGALRPDVQPMKAVSALGLALLGASLWLQHRGRFVVAGRICAWLVLGLVLARAIEVGFHLRLLDFWPQSSGAMRATATSRQSVTALACAALALLTLRQERPWAAWFANLVIAFAVAGVLARAFDPLVGRTLTLRMASDLSFGLALLGFGTLLARPGDQHVRFLFAPTMPGLLARRLFIAVAVVPLVLSLLLVWGLERNYLSLPDGIVLLVVAIIVFGFATALFSIDAATGIQQSREESEQARLLLTARLQEQAAQLQETISQRTAELREANANLRAAAESNALLALAAQNTVGGMVITDADGRIEWVNAAFTRLTGYELAEVKGRKPGHFLQGEGTDAATVARLREAETHGRPCTVEVLNYTKQGTPFWQLIDIQPVRERGGRLVNFVANHTDVTNQRADKLRLQTLNQRLELATRSAALGVWEWDAVANRNVWDERSLAIYGLTAADFNGTRDDWSRRLHPEDRTRALAAVQAALAHSDHYEVEFRIIRATDSAVRHVQSRAVIQRDADGRVLRLIGTERDVTAEREVTSQLEALNERLRLALRSANFGVWEIDVLTGRRVWDARMFEIYGTRPDEFTHSIADWSRVLHPEDRERCLERVRRVIAGEIANYDDRFRVIRPDGAERHIEAHGYLQRDVAGKPIRLVGLIRDITSDKQLEQALEFAEQRWQLAIEGSNDSVWDWDITANQIYHDDRWARMLGYEPGEIPDTIEAWKALAHPDDLAANEAETQQHFAGKTSFYQHELRMRAKTGEWRWILDRGKVVRRAPDGRPLRMAGTHSDITTRKSLEERLRQTEELAQEVSRLAQIGGWEINLVNSQVMWTETTRRIHDVDESFQPSIESMWQFFPPEALVTLQSALRDATPNAPSFDIEVPLTTARGRRVWVRMLGHGEFRGSKAVAVRGAIQDITARHESEEARRELEAQLFQAQKMETLGTLAGGIAHDFNNLLTGIIGYHELAADSVPEDHPARACLNEARNASLRARELVEQILTFGRHSASTEHGPLDLPLVVEEARRFLRATLPANITIEVHGTSHIPAVLGDATQLHQVILNLGSNAAHAMRLHGGTLRIVLEPAEVTPDLALTLGGPPASSYVRLSVSDTGHGMDESTRRRIFDPFFTTKKTREGTGLGLAVVHGIVRSHRGAIDVESAPGSGSTFHIYLPTATDDSTHAEPGTESAPRGGGEYVCVVDDEEVVGSCTKLVLESKGYRTLIFGSAEQCLAEMEGQPGGCAVLVTDQTMPGMQGTELAAALRRTNPGLPVVIMSGYFSKISPQALDELGQIELLAKPFTTDELAHAVHRALHPVTNGS